MLILNPLVPKPVHLLRVRNYPSVPLRDKWMLPRVSGVYFAVRGWRILYIGKSTNIHARWNSYQFGPHHKQDDLLRIDETIGDVDIHYCRWGEQMIGFIEALEIRRFKPALNKCIEPIADNINLTVIGYLFKQFCAEGLMLALAAGVIGLLLWHFAVRFA